MVCHGIVWYGRVVCHRVQCGTPYSIVWYEWYSVMWYAWYGVMWYGIGYNMVRCTLIHLAMSVFLPIFYFLMLYSTVRIPVLKAGCFML